MMVDGTPLIAGNECPGRRTVTIMSPAAASDVAVLRRALMAGVAATVLTVGGPAIAQTTGSNAAPITTEANPGEDAEGERDSERLNESFQPKGLEVGSFLFFPKLEVDTIYNSNIFAQGEDEESDLIWRVSPEFQFRSRFTTHELNVGGKVDRYYYNEFTNDDRTDYSGNIDGRLDIQSDWEATLFVDAFNRGEDRGSPNEAGGISPTETNGVLTRVSTRREMGRFVFAVTGTASRKTFENVLTSLGTTVTNGDRDRWEYEGEGRFEYASFDMASLIAVVSANKRSYDDDLDDNGFNRDSEGFRIDGGVSLDITQVVKGDVTIGYFEQSYEDARLNSPSGLTVRTSLNWTPSRMTVVVPSLERQVDESVTVDVSSIVRTSAGVLVRHELQRNVVLTATANVRYEDYKGTDESAWNYDSRLRGIYAFSPEFYVGGEVSYRERNSSNPGSSYNQYALTARIGLRI